MSTPEATTASVPAKREEHWLNAWARQSLPAVLPAHLTPEKVVRVALAEFARKPDLARCEKGSICLAILTASQLGLEVASPLGEAYLIPRKDVCTLQIGYKGFLKLLRNSGEIRTVIAECVFDGEQFSVEVDTSRDNSIEVKHAPDYVNGTRDPKRIVAAYCIVQTRDGGRYVAVCSRAEIEERRKRGASGMGRSSPWDTDYAAMARKSAIRKLLVGGTVPMSTELARAVEHEIAEDVEHRVEVARPAARLLDVIDAPTEAPTAGGEE